ncbi:MAG: hypothetical protein CMH57_02630 [Myxococcales bacterium]|nr:hypothetical protein [Myxococcales bacterium]
MGALNDLQVERTRQLAAQGPVVWHLKLGAGVTLTSRCRACDVVTQTLCGPCSRVAWGWLMDPFAEAELVWGEDAIECLAAARRTTA